MHAQRQSMVSTIHDGILEGGGIWYWTDEESKLVQFLMGCARVGYAINIVETDKWLR